MHARVYRRERRRNACAELRSACVKHAELCLRLFPRDVVRRRPGRTAVAYAAPVCTHRRRHGATSGSIGAPCLPRACRDERPVDSRLCSCLVPAPHVRRSAGASAQHTANRLRSEQGLVSQRRRGGGRVRGSAVCCCYEHEGLRRTVLTARRCRRAPRRPGVEGHSRSTSHGPRWPLHAGPQPQRIGAQPRRAITAAALQGAQVAGSAPLGARERAAAVPQLSALCLTACR